MNRSFIFTVLLASTIYTGIRLLDVIGDDRRATEAELALNQASVACLIRQAEAEKSGNSAEVDRCREESQALLARRKAMRPGVR